MPSQSQLWPAGQPAEVVDEQSSLAYAAARVSRPQHAFGDLRDIWPLAPPLQTSPSESAGVGFSRDEGKARLGAVLAAGSV
jgi:hypothetical protein